MAIPHAHEPRLPNGRPHRVSFVGRHLSSVASPWPLRGIARMLGLGLLPSLLVIGPVSFSLAQQWIVSPRFSVSAGEAAARREGAVAIRLCSVLPFSIIPAILRAPAQKDGVGLQYLSARPVVPCSLGSCLTVVQWLYINALLSCSCWFSISLRIDILTLGQVGPLI